MAAAAEGVEKVVLVDTISGFRASRKQVTREADFSSKVRMPWLFPYLDSKLKAQETAEQFKHRMTIVFVHCSPIYGAGDTHDHTGCIIRYLANNKVTMAPPGGTSVIDVNDAADACIYACRLDRSQQLVVTGEHRLFVDLYNIILELLGTEHRISRTIPAWLYEPIFCAAIVADFMGNDTQFSPYLIRNGFSFRYYSSVRTQEVLGWRPTTAIETSIRRQVVWMRANGRLAKSIGKG
jgi:nucleoside-diphosphate-sugar epimerase